MSVLYNNFIVTFIEINIRVSRNLVFRLGHTPPANFDQDAPQTMSLIAQFILSSQSGWSFDHAPASQIRLSIYLHPYHYSTL